MTDANKTGVGVDRGVSGYSATANRGTGTSAATVRLSATTSTTAKRVPPKVRPNPDKEDGSSSSEDDDPVITAMKEDLMRWAPRGPPAEPIYTRPKGTQSDAPKSGPEPLTDKDPAAAPNQKPAGPPTR